MKPTSIEKLLREHPVLKEIPARYLAAILGCVTTCRFGRGEHLFREGESSTRFFLIRSGAVRLEYPVEGEESVAIQTLGRDEIVGWSWLMEPRTRHFDAVASEEVRALCIETSRLVEALEQDHELGFHLFRSFAGLTVRRLRATQMQLVSLRRRQPADPEAGES